MGFAIYYAHQFEKFNALADKLAQFQNLLRPEDVIFFKNNSMVKKKILFIVKIFMKFIKLS